MRSRFGVPLRLPATLLLLAACSGDASGPKIGPPSAIVSVSGSGQTGLVATALTQPIIVRVTDAQNQPVAGVTVSFNVAAGGGSLTPATGTTDATGLAQTRWTLGTNSSEEQKVEARAGGVTAVVAFTATAQPGAATALVKSAGDGQTGPVGAALTSELAVRVADQYGNGITNATISWAVVTGSGAIAPGTSQSGPDGIARARWTLGGTLNSQSASATVSGLAPVVFGALGAPGAVATVTVEPASSTIALGATRQFSAQLKDAFNNTITGRTVTWTVQDNAVASVDNSGLARGIAAGSTQIIATSEGKSASAVLTVSGTPVLNPVISAIAPAVVQAGETATITGTNFSGTAASNAVTVNGVSATVTAATATQLTVRIPERTLLGCEPTRNLNVVVNVGGNAATRSHPVSAATQRTLARGAFVNLTGDDVRCNELALGSGRYLIAVTNANTDAVSSVGFQLRGGAGASGLSTVMPVVAPSRSLQQRALSPDAAEAQREAKAHARVQDNNLDLIRRMGAVERTQTRSNNAAVSAVAPPPNVGDTLAIRMANPQQLSCNVTLADIRARVVYVGARGVVLEDVAAPLAGTMDSLYRAVGTEFDNTMYPILTTNFGDPLQYDTQLDNNQRFFMVFTKRVNDMEGIAGYVVSTDFYPRAQCNSSNSAEIFYARVPTSAAAGFSGDTRESWLRRTRTVIIHEVKHIVSFSGRFLRANGAPVASDFEHRWLEEGSAMLAEELWARSVFGYAQRGNVNYRSSVYCEVRPEGVPECAGKPRSMFDHFLLLHDYEAEIESRSPLGPTTGSDFTYYGSGWAFLRWAIDHYSTSESAFLRALTGETSARGTANIAARTGRPIEELLTDFALALALDDRQGFTATRPQHTMPSWNLPEIFQSLHGDFVGQCATCFIPAPLAKRNVVYGDFNVNVSTLQGGTMAMFELSGTQAGRQLLELRGPSGGSPASNLRVSIVRVD